MLRARLFLFAFVFVFPPVLAVVLFSGVARAQSITASGQVLPERFVGSQDLGTSTRGPDQNPTGISYDDCARDMTLVFDVTLSGFTGNDDLEIWASLTSDCTSATDRGFGGSTAPICWLVGRDSAGAGLEISASQTRSYPIRVRDLVGWQSVPPTSASAADPPPKGPEACTAQTSFAAVPITVNFLAVSSSHVSDGMPYPYPINTDMVGPPAPQNVGKAAGDTLLDITWTPNTDSDTAGYRVFLDPIPGQEGAAGATPEAGADVATVCPDTGADAACYGITRGSSGAAATGVHCNDPILSSGFVVDAGADAQGAVVPPEYDDAGNLVSEGGTESGVGGISTIPPQYAVAVLTGPNSEYQITGLVDGVWYDAVVAAVDGTGNVGPPSPQVCDYPDKVADFWDDYRNDGGASQGGFCALDTVGAGGTSLATVAAGVALLAIARRRRRA